MFMFENVVLWPYLRTCRTNRVILYDIDYLNQFLVKQIYNHTIHIASGFIGPVMEKLFYLSW